VLCGRGPGGKPAAAAQRRAGSDMEEAQLILVVDDEKRMRESIQRLLAESGYDIRTCAGGEEALRRLDRQAYDLVLLDLVMPGMDGPEVLRRIKAGQPDLPVIVISGHGSLEAAVGLLKQGAFDYIRKPFEAEELARRVAIALEQKRLRREKARISSRLADAEQQYHYIVENSPDMIYTLDEGGNFSFVNSAFERLLGYTREEIMGQHYSGIIYTGDLEKSRYVFNERRTGRRATCGAELHLKPGRHEAPQRSLRESSEGFPVELNSQGIYARPADAGEKRFLGTYGVARDIRDRKLLEAHLQQAEKMEAVGRLAGGIAHDFNNLLAAIVGNIALVKMNLPPADEAYRRLAEIEKASFRARDLTRQLITFAQGGVPVKEPGPLGEIVEEAGTFVLRGSNVRGLYSFPENLWCVRLDSGQIGQVVQNLIINADQAMPDGGIVRVRGENVTVTEAYHLPLKPGRYVRVSVRDQGMGIPGEHIKKIFDPFFTTKRDGTGLGLSTAYSIMKAHGGYLDVEASPGEGAVFYFYLPAESGPAAGSPKKKARLYRGSGRILVMDDDEELLTVYKRVLRRLGYSPVLVHEGSEALEAYREAREAGEPFDCVILDLTIPGGLGGKATIEELIRLDPGVRAVLASGYAGGRLRMDYRRCGFKAFVEKPFDIYDLSEVLWRILQSEGD
jgi:two-component system cell cycle sensor histidine kinase/response regulator CckA